ncbi:hypothetical protein QO010_003340 [Caulobacter ginsengisoli]|uniref:Uncharacterized protein n=1 Tax=Caulobacter ginsengisoli TaxID=400775 RepID=A0ABU0IU68_9CAUL|nr:hypothetical protein [Caulobacter ginsengisoli]MDQ0465551.1 hypothetical protein [Caulobacter ginsengisoli]
MTATDPTELGRARRARLKRMDAIHPIVAEIVDTLQALGGAAHRDLVADQIAVRRSGRTLRASPALKADVFQAFDAHCETTPLQATGRLLFHKPFGPASHRWALSPAASAFIENARRQR